MYVRAMCMSDTHACHLMSYILGVDSSQSPPALPHTARKERIRRTRAAKPHLLSAASKRRLNIISRISPSQHTPSKLAYLFTQSPSSSSPSPQSTSSSSSPLRDYVFHLWFDCSTCYRYYCETCAGTPAVCSQCGGEMLEVYDQLMDEDKSQSTKCCICSALCPS